MTGPALQRAEAIAVVTRHLRDDDVAVFANGYISREGHRERDSPRHFYMLGSMGLAASIGLGVSLALPAVQVVVFDGDGNLLMGLGGLAMVGAWQPHRFLHVVLDNGTYGSTGSQPTLSPTADFAAIATAAGYRSAATAATPAELESATAKGLTVDGPALIRVRVDAAERDVAPRVPHEPMALAARFIASIGTT